MEYKKIRFSYAVSAATWIMAVLIFCSPFTRTIIADETTAPVQEIHGVTEDLENPVKGLLDASPAGIPEPHSDSYLVYDALSDTMLVGKDYDTPMEPASITQIMTVLLALENLQSSDKITIKPSMYDTIPDEFVRIGFVEGEEVTVEECLYSCILKSANDACMALAIQMGGTEAGFVEMMNQRAAELGCTNTHFTNPYGKYDYEHYSTCHDLALILQAALKHPQYTAIATSLSYTMEPTNKYNDKRIMNNGNRYISSPQIAYEYYIGGKTGFADGFGYTIIAGAEKEGKRLVGVMLRTSDAEKRYSELTELLEFCFSKYTTTKIEDSEFLETEKTTVTQIEAALEGSGLSISSTKLEHLEYYSVPLALADSGYSNIVELTSVVISPDLGEQVVLVPINRVFSDGTSYRIGCFSVEIINSNVVKEEKKEPKEESSLGILNLIIIIFVSLVLLAATIFAIGLFLKLTRKRKLRENNKNPTVL